MSTSKSKSNPQASRGNPANYSQMYKNSAASAAQKSGADPAAKQPMSASPTEAPQVRAATSDTVDWKNEYAYVLGDLRRLAIVTAGLVVSIIVVGLFI